MKKNDKSKNDKHMRLKFFLLLTAKIEKLSNLIPHKKQEMTNIGQKF